MVAGLLRRLGFPHDTVAPLKDTHDGPDVLITAHGCSIGVEVTQIQTPPEERESYSWMEEIVRRAERAYLDAGGPPVRVQLSFLPGTNLRGVDRREAGRPLAQFLLDPPGSVHSGISSVEPRNIPGPLSGHVLQLQFWSEPDPGPWQCIQAGPVEALTDEVPAAAIARKTERLPAYRNKGFDKYWLLICAPPENPACRFEDGRNFSPSTIESPFDRTFFYDGWQMFELGNRK